MATIGVCNHMPEVYCQTCRPDLWDTSKPSGSFWVTHSTNTMPRCVHGLPADDHGCQPKDTPARAIVDQRFVGARRAVDDLLTALAVPRDDHTADTPNRVAKSLLELLSGYGEDPSLHLDTTFPGPEDAGVVVLSGLRFTSLCAHHLLPFTGTGTVAYLPKPRQPIVGLSKLARVLDGYSRRLQTQEWLGRDVADALVAKLDPAGAAVILTSHHDCMGIRGVKQPDAVMTTSSLRGMFLTNDAQRAELLSLHRAGQ